MYKYYIIPEDMWSLIFLIIFKAVIAFSLVKSGNGESGVSLYEYMNSHNEHVPNSSSVYNINIIFYYIFI